MPQARSCRGASLVEIAVVLALFSLLAVGLGSALRTQAHAVGAAQDGHEVFLRAQAALQRIRSELAMAVQTPAGVASPSYEVSETSLTFRPAVGALAETDAEYAAAAEAGLVSVNHIQYAPYVKTIAFDAATGRVTVSATGTLPAGVPAEQTIATDVASFRFFDGESQADPPAAATRADWVIGIEIVIRRTSLAPGNYGAAVDSSLGGVVLREKVRVFPELIFSHQSKNAAVGP